MRVLIPKNLYPLARLRNKIDPTKAELMSAPDIENDHPILLDRRSKWIDYGRNRDVLLGHMAKNRIKVKYTYDKAGFDSFNDRFETVPAPKTENKTDLFSTQSYETGEQPKKKRSRKSKK